MEPRANNNSTNDGTTVNVGRQGLGTSAWLTILLFSISTALSVGFSLGTFETKAHAEEVKKALEQEMEKKYMPRELSIEKWTNNETAHTTIKTALEENTRALKALEIYLKTHVK
jgi:hypothetical protein